MTELSQKLDNIIRKAHQLLQQSNALKQENAVLKEELDLFKQYLKENQQYIIELVEKLKIARIAQQLSSSEENPELKELKLKINEYVREVDKCIKILSE